MRVLNTRVSLWKNGFEILEDKGFYGVGVKWSCVNIPAHITDHILSELHGFYRMKV